MGKKNYSRRNFFRSLTTSPVDTDPSDNNEDPLFQKYSRKKLTTRSYSTEVAQLQVGKEDTEAVQRVGTPVTSGLQPYTGTWTELEVLHLLRRTSFGTKKAWIDALMPLTPSAAVDAVLNFSVTPATQPAVWYNSTVLNFTDENNLAQGADWTNDFFPTGSVGQTSNHYRMDSLRRWSFGLTLNGNGDIREKMVWFWFHFIPIDFETIFQSSNSYINTNSARVFYKYMKLLRDNSLGNFKSLIRAIAVEPAMMYYLNNQANSANAPDENFARELMELFTLGKDDPNNTYSQSDVVEAAKVLTGWRVQSLNTASPATNFVSGSHKTGNKVFSSFFATPPATSHTITGQTGAAGANELDALLTMIFNKSTEVSKYICRRLYRYFVYYDIDANIEANVITPLAQTFVANNWNIRPVLEQLFKSQHFFDAPNRGCYIKSPFDLVAGTLNTLAVDTTDSNIESQYRIWSKYNDGYCLGMEQQMGSIPNVSGWNAFYQTPAYHQYWINSNTAQKRFSFVKEMVNLHTISAVYAPIVPPATTASLRKFGIDTVAFAAQFGAAVAGNPDDPSNPNKLVAACIRRLLPVDLSQIQKDAIKARTLLYQQTTDNYWTVAWNNYIGAPTDATKRRVVEDRLKTLIAELTQLAEYQLM